MFWFAYLLLFAIGVTASSKISISIPPFAKECIYHELTEHNNALFVSYQVLRGGDFELDFTIVSPKGDTIINQKDEKYADFVLKTFGLGEYSFCFSNPHKDLKKVEFTLKLGNGEESENTTGDKEDVVAYHSLSEIDRNLNKIERIMNYLRAREWRNMSTVESTQSRIVYLSMIIILLTVGVNVAQASVVQFLFAGREKSFV